MSQLMPTSALDSIEASLKQKRKLRGKGRPLYFVPSLWIGEGNAKAVRVDPADFYLDIIKKVKKSKPRRQTIPVGGEWTREAVIYNMFVRTTIAFDHNANRKLDLPVNDDGFRETGTFLKAIALLPYIKRLGANTIHLLPITAIGQDGNKGTLGSPYAIRNPYELDENLSEPWLGVGVKTEFKAFVEAAHRIGIRVVVEFVFRTAAKDADWVKEYPYWFYWIHEGVELRDPQQPDEQKYGSPLFSAAELERIHYDVREHQHDNLLPPHPVYRDFFTATPDPERVVKEDRRYVGILSSGQRVKIAGAFADWPPDDNQPPWGDVTYLRMYTHPDFNYIAYNTIRMYDGRLTQPQYVNRPLWDKIVGIIPYYQREFQIDGVMIDMGHALPMQLKSEIVQAARTIDPDFAFWDETFSVTRRSREEGYNAVIGFCWIDENHPARMKALCRRMASEGFPIPFFATAESHNTPRAATRTGGVTYSRWAWVINNFIPAIPFIHSGFELAETFPINTGLDFSKEELRHLPSEKLALFSEYAYDWQSKIQFTDFAGKVAKLRAKYKNLIVDSGPQSFVMLHESNEHILAFARVSNPTGRRLAIVSNTNWASMEQSLVRIDTRKKTVTDLLGGKKMRVHGGQIDVRLQPGQCLVFEY